ncbi:hypothetical protein [Caulobacter sp. LARHSG274]
MAQRRLARASLVMSALPLPAKPIVVSSLIDARLAGIVYAMLQLRRWRGEVKRDRQAPAADSHWGDATLDALLIGLQPDVERACGRSLLATYAYARLYGGGDALVRHRDRPAAEVAVTLHLGARGGAPPPICFAPDIAVIQKPGDGVIYPGDRLDHWRAPFDGENFGQLFLNYVMADGERTDLVHDGRRGAFPPVLSPRLTTNAR